jgi:hypothetical protein
MSLATWTPDALSSERTPYRGQVWRVVEAQHHVSTLKLVDTLDEQEVLERAIEAAKPTVPEPCRHLDYLLATPFRYEPAYPKGSRFRRAGHTPGVYYAAEAIETAVAELAFLRLLFYAESPGVEPPLGAAEYTAFAALVATDRALDLTRAQLAEDRALWTDPTAYEPCQSLAERARSIDVEILRYESVRDPDRRANIAVLQCAAFSRPDAHERQTWRLRVRRESVQAIREFPDLRLEFGRKAFSADPRLQANAGR